jgi:hypothetical protein
MRIIDIYSKDGKKTIRAAVIGTCRLANPLLKLEKSECAKVIWEHSGFAHSIHDALQWISIITLEKEVPTELAPLIYGIPRDSLNRTKSKEHWQRGKELMESVDLFLVELSTRNRIYTDDFDFNSDYLTEHFVRPGGLALLDWWSKVCQGGSYSETDLEYLLESASKLHSGFPEHLESILSQCRRINEKNSQVLDAIEYLNHQITNSQCTIIANPDASNINFKSFLAHVSTETKSFRYLDPNVFIRDFEPAEVFMGEGKDKNHYSQSFELRMGEYIRDFIFSDIQCSALENKEEFITAKTIPNSPNGATLENKNVFFDSQGNEHITVQLRGTSINTQGWFRFSFKLGNGILDEQYSPILKDSTSKEFMQMNETLKNGNSSWDCIVWLDRRDEHFLEIKLKLNPSIEPRLKMMNIELESLEHSFQKSVFSVQESLNRFNPNLISEDTPLLEIELPDPTISNGTGGITLQGMSEEDKPNVEISIELRCESGEEVGIRLFNGHNWTAELAKTSVDFQKIVISEQIDNCTQQKPRINFFNYSKGTTIQIKDYSVGQYKH